MRILTIGHSNRTLAELIGLLTRHGVELVVDVRRRPSSRRQPHFSKGSLEDALPRADIAYLWLEGLGGHRSRRDGSDHTAWDSPGLAGYADHLDSAEFAAAVGRLLEVAAGRRTAVMCAEGRWQDCHRRLISDWLATHGHDVVHVVSEERTEPHELTGFARVADGRLIYDAGQRTLPGLSE